MTRIAPYALAAAALLAPSLFGAPTSPWAGTVALVAASIALAVAACEQASAAAVAAGALGALAGGTLGVLGPALAGAAVLLVATAPRALRLRTLGARLAHAVAAVVGGAGGGALVSAWRGEPIALRVVALIVAVALASAPWLLDADDPIAHALACAAAESDEPVRSALDAAATLRRRAEASPLDRATRGRARGAWRALARLVEARRRLPSSRLAAPVVARIDARLVAHAATLSRVYAAAEASRAAALGVEDEPRRALDGDGAALEEIGRALLELE